MKPETVTYLNSLNRQFYETTASAFDETRQHPWDGWERLRANLPAARPLRVLDVGCGNGRFGVFLADELSAMTYHGVDNNPSLLGYARDVLQGRPGITTTFSQQDIVADGLAVTGDYDLVVLFGVIHHVPGAANRTALLCQLADCVAPGGMLAFAAWRFMDNPRLRRKTVDWPPDVEREPGDYLLDWRRGEVANRYCHFVDDEEHVSLIEATGLTHVGDYRADGSDGRSNRYSLLARSNGR